MNNNNTPLISVIVPVFNAEKTIDQCIESICLQTYKKLEICIVDDGSTDRSSEKIEQWAQNDRRIKLFKGRNTGVAHARNRGLSMATGEYIALVDSDDWIEKNYIENLCSALIQTRADASISYRGGKCKIN